MYSCNLLVSVLGNSTVIYIVYKHKDMRTTTNLLLVNMACADILVATLYMANQLKFLYLFNKWFGGVTGLILCKTAFASQYLPACATVWSTAVISIDRLLTIISPLKKSFISTYCKTILGSIWLFSSLLIGHWVLFPRFLFINKMWFCIFRPKFSFLFHFQHASLAFVLAVPLVRIILSYSIICYRLHNRKVPGLNTNQQVQRVAATARKVSRLTIVIISSFPFCWLPFFLFVAIVRDPYKIPVVFISVIWLSQLYNAFNPVICISSNTNFRQRVPLFFKPNE